MPTLTAALERPETWQDLHRAYAEARAGGPVYTDPGGMVFVLGHPEASALLKDRALGITDLLALYGITSGPAWEWWHQVMASLNPPEHTRVRGTVSRAFTPRAVDQLRSRIRELATELLDAADPEDLDVIGSFANELPSRVMAHMLAIPREDQAEFSQWTADIGLIFGAAAARDGTLLRHIEDVLGRLYEYVGRLSAARRRAPGEDLLSMLIHAQADEERLSEDELAALIANLLFAGHDTTRSQLMIAFYLLALHPDQFDRLRADPDLAVTAQEEMVRYEPSVVGTARQPFEDVKVAGVTLPAGVPVQLALIAASRDPAVYEDPDRFDICRTNAQPVHFGGGIHHCLGASLARAEIQETLQLLTDRYRRIDVLDEPAWVPYASIRRLANLRVRLTPAD